MSKTLGRDDLLKCNYLKRELVEIPGSDISVYVREFSAAQVLQFNQRIEEMRKNGIKDTTPEMDLDIMTYAVSLSVCDENGVLLFSSEEDASGLKDSLGISTITTLGTKALSISGLNKTAIDTLSSEVADNLPNDQMTSLLSDSPRNSRKRKRK